MTRVLVVDDSRLARMTVKKRLSAKRPDWIFVEAGNGVEALDVIKGDDIKYAVVDYNMPEMDGVELATSLAELYPDMRVSLLTANLQDYLREAAEELKCHLAEKPVDEECIDKILAFFDD